MENQQVLIAMSGGVDSSVAAFLMLQKGAGCQGVTMALCPDSGPDAAADAEKVAQRLRIPFSLLQAQEDFKDLVTEPFIRSYEAGLTPNPCITCNRRIKFGLLLEYALARGCSHIVTGHYAVIRQDPGSGRYLLYKAADKAKDQTYFLACLNQHQLSHTLLPLGELTKEQVRQIAQAQGFLNARKRDSQDICFVPNGDYKAYMEQVRGIRYPAGDFLDLNGQVLGRHNGAVGYTLGQRKGLGLAMGEPVYVCGKDMEANTVTVGPNEALFQSSLIAGNWNWLPFEALEAPMRVTAKARYRHAEQPATVYPLPDGLARVEFDSPQRAITPGQAVVLYKGDMVVGAGTILPEN